MSAPAWHAPAIRVRAVSAEDETSATTLAERLSLPRDPTVLPAAGSAPTPAAGSARANRPGRRRRRRAGAIAPDGTASWTLLVDGARRVLERPDGVRLELDFTAGRTAARQRETGLVHQPLSRALGVARLRRRLGRPPAIVDATGGLGRDAWFAASLGCPVTMIERSPIVHALLEAALATARGTPATAETAARITLVHGEADGLLDTLAPAQTEVVYLDPMYPSVRRRAAVTKGMQFLHDLLGPPEAASPLLGAALAAATCQVTVKRPSNAPPVAGDASFDGQRATIESPGTRYDLYLLPVPFGN